MAAKDFGPRLRDLREREGISLRELERRSGINSGYLSQLERGEVSQPTPSMLERLANAYGLPLETLMSWAGYKVGTPAMTPAHAKALKYLGENPSDEEVEAIRAVLKVLRARKGFAEPSPHDRALAGPEIELIRGYALALLREVGNLGEFPTKLDDLMTAARLVEAGEITLTLDERRSLRRRLGDKLDRVLRQLKGMITFDNGEIWLAPDLASTRRRFVQAHEIGHHILPVHHELAYLDDASTLGEGVREACEREANQAAIELLAQGDELRKRADDSRFSRVNLELCASLADISLQATARRIGEESRREVASVIWYRGRATGKLMPAHLYCSPSFEERFRWRAGRFPAAAAQETARAAARSFDARALIATEISERAVSLDCEAVDTPYALIGLFSAGPVRRLSGVFPVRR